MPACLLSPGSRGRSGPRDRLRGGLWLCRGDRLGISGAAAAAVALAGGLVGAAPADAAPADAATTAAVATFSGVAATSSSNAWAVGTWSQSNTTYKTLIERWNGTAWKVQTSPNPAPGDWDENVLNGVAGLSSSDAWAVGWSYVNGSGHKKMTCIGPAEVVSG